MFWGCICFNALINLVPLYHRILKESNYLKSINLDPILLFAPFFGNYFLLMHDDALLHIARRVTAYLRVINVQMLK